MYRYSYVWMIGIMLSGCAQGQHALDASDLLRMGGAKLGLISSYEMIRHDFDNGHIMRARELAIAIDKQDADYVRAHLFLKKSIEPARRRLFTHYLREARKREAGKQWAKAMWAYDQAEAVTVKPEVMRKKRDAMALKQRQLRLNGLIVIRRNLDDHLLQDMHLYQPPKGLNADDETYVYQYDQYVDLLDNRSSQAMRDVRRYMHKGLPEIAYIEIESYLRMRDDASDAKLLRDEIVKALPTGLHIPARQKVRRFNMASRTASRKGVTAAISEADIRAIWKQGDLIKAISLAGQYSRNGGKGADQLLTQLQKRAKAQAAILFARGSKAFQSERLEKAIADWRQAIALNPDESEYVEALRRAVQLQQRLAVLRNKQAVPDVQPDTTEHE